MQVRAIVEAAIECKKKAKVNAMPEIMIPLVGIAKELDAPNQLAIETIHDVAEGRHGGEEASSTSRSAR